MGADGVAFIEYESGTSLEDLKAKLSDSRISYGCFKVLGVDTRGAVVATRTKYCAFTWVGKNVNKLRVAKSIAHKKDMLKYFAGHHLSLELYDRADLTEAGVEKKLRDAGGAHQPSDMQCVVVSLGRRQRALVARQSHGSLAPAPRPLTLITGSPAAATRSRP